MRNQDKDYRRWITSRRWGALRRQVLTARPLCERCREAGKVVAAGEVHHVRPVESGVSKAEQERLMFAPSNLMAVCHQCHVEIHIELGRGGRILAAKRNAQKTNEIIARFFPESPSEATPGGYF